MIWGALLLVDNDTSDVASSFLKSCRHTIRVILHILVLKEGQALEYSLDWLLQIWCMPVFP